VKRDGGEEPYHVASEGNGKRIYIGDKKVFLDPGVYTYRLTYHTDRQVGYFDDYDEIYWNVTGNFWDFPIDHVTATVQLPAQVPESQLRITAYTGPRGANGRDYSASVEAPGRVRFETTRRFGPGEGLTVAVGFPKGVVTEPTAAQKRLWFLRDNLGLIAGVAGLAASFTWYLFAWSRVGRDPASGVIYPRYEAPSGYSPASLRYVWRMGFDKTCFAAALVSLAAKKALRLDKDDGDYEVDKLVDNPDTDSRTERALFRKLFSGGDSLRFEKSNHSRISSVVKAHERALSVAYEGRYFKRHRVWLIPGLLLSLGTVLLMLLLIPGSEKFAGLFLLLWLTIWSFGTAALVAGAWRAWRDLHGVLDGVKALFATFFALPFAVGEVAALGAFAFLVGWIPALVVTGVLALNVIFYQLIKARTPDGRKLVDEIEGLRLYLGVAERQDLERINAEEPPKTLERFEKLLPYAVALDCAETWADRFAEDIRRAEQAGEIQSRGWYAAASGGGRGFSASSLGAGLASGLASAVASASTAPGSSSGSGGGGFSGGGGGGGGGGGW